MSNDNSGPTTTGARAVIDNVDTEEWLDTNPGPTPSGPPALRLEPNPHAEADATIAEIMAKPKQEEPYGEHGHS